MDVYLPQFTPQASKLWNSMAVERQSLLLSKVWCSHCSHCSHSVIIKNFIGAVKSGDLLLVGKCAECHGDVARLVESG